MVILTHTKISDLRALEVLLLVPTGVVFVRLLTYARAHFTLRMVRNPTYPSTRLGRLSWNDWGSDKGGIIMSPLIFRIDLSWQSAISACSCGTSI